MPHEKASNRIAEYIKNTGKEETICVKTRRLQQSPKGCLKTFLVGFFDDFPQPATEAGAARRLHGLRASAVFSGWDKDTMCRSRVGLFDRSGSRKAREIGTVRTDGPWAAPTVPVASRRERRADPSDRTRPSPFRSKGPGTRGTWLRQVLPSGEKESRFRRRSFFPAGAGLLRGRLLAEAQFRSGTVPLPTATACAREATPPGVFFLHET